MSRFAFAALLALAVGCGPAAVSDHGTTGTTHRDAGTQPSDGGCSSRSCPANGCGVIEDGCGGTLNCGSCSSGQTCGGGGTPNVCGVGTCTAKTCTTLGADCGQVSDGCSATLSCGTCISPETCGGTGQPNRCGCKPETDLAICTRLQKQCGTVVAFDNCEASRTVDCGGCNAPDVCGGSGVPNQCGSCKKETDLAFCTRLEKNCDSVTAPDNCGNSRTVNCGVCDSPLTCGGTGVANVCGNGNCTPTTCAAKGYNCGPLSDGCGVTLNCGSCAMTGCTCTGGHKVETSCGDSQDNDGDGLTDCDDSDCQGSAACGVETLCSDGKDNDGDGLIDCADPDCKSASNCGSETNCKDGLDNDHDLLVDCADPDCASSPDCPRIETSCSDGKDNDGDGKIDCADPDCAVDAACLTTNTCIACADLMNCLFQSCGPGCSCGFATGPQETDCGDRLDNDRDGLVDCEDPDCAGSANCPSPEDCTDGKDNDLDGAIDCADTDCMAKPVCIAVKYDGDPCTKDAECKSGTCLTEAVDGYPHGYCSGTCTTPGAACLGGGVCLARAGGNVCRSKCDCAGQTGCPTNGGCRTGYVCADGYVDPNNTSTGDSYYCVARCTSDADCGTGAAGYGCNLWSGKCGLKDQGKVKTGGACTADANCESALCDTSMPGGMCLSGCNLNNKICGGDAHCLDDGFTGDAFGICWDGCTVPTDCRAGSYTCDKSTGVGVCQPTCKLAQEICTGNQDCCSGMCFIGMCF